MGGRLQFFSHNWEQISQDKKTVAGFKMEFVDNPYQDKEPTQIPLEKGPGTGRGACKDGNKQAIEPIKHTSDACFISRMFVVAKPDHSWRPG